jgi:hypothetical protein
MVVFASLFGKLAQRLSVSTIGETLQSHVGILPNPQATLRTLHSGRG